MIAYVDTSVLLRIVLREPQPLQEWPDLALGVASPIVRVECHRNLERLWLLNNLSDEELFANRRESEAILNRLVTVPIDGRIMERAAAPMPLAIKTLDAIHLASAILYRSAQPPDERPILMATHDRALAAAARAMNFDVIGIGA